MNDQAIKDLHRSLCRSTIGTTSEHAEKALRRFMQSYQNHLRLTNMREHDAARELWLAVRSQAAEVAHLVAENVIELAEGAH